MVQGCTGAGGNAGARVGVAEPPLRRAALWPWIGCDKWQRTTRSSQRFTCFSVALIPGERRPRVETKGNIVGLEECPDGVRHISRFIDIAPVNPTNQRAYVSPTQNLRVPHHRHAADLVAGTRIVDDERRARVDLEVRHLCAA